MAKMRPEHDAFLVPTDESEMMEPKGPRVRYQNHPRRFLLEVALPLYLVYHCVSNRHAMAGIPVFGVPFRIMNFFVDPVVSFFGYGPNILYIRVIVVPFP